MNTKPLSEFHVLSFFSSLDAPASYPLQQCNKGEKERRCRVNVGTALKEKMNFGSNLIGTPKIKKIKKILFSFFLKLIIKKKKIIHDLYSMSYLWLAWSAGKWICLHVLATHPQAGWICARVVWNLFLLVSGEFQFPKLIKDTTASPPPTERRSISA